MKILALTVMIVIAATLAAYADIPSPEKRVPNDTPAKGIETLLNIRLDKDAKEARLIIPKSRIKELRAELEQMDENDDTAVMTSSGGISRTRTAVSGLFLSLAIVFGGLWFVQSGKGANGTGKALMVLAVVTGIASGATYVYANAGPPSEARSITGKMFAPGVHIYGFGYGNVRLELSDKERLELIVPNPPETKPSE